MKYTIFFIGLLFLTLVKADVRKDVGLFSHQNTEDWKQEIFQGETDYQLLQLDGQYVLSANSDKSASAFYLEKEFDLTKTPILNWSWRSDNRLQIDDETTKPGDDFIARVYVIKKGGILFWNTKAINYVWSYQHKKGALWDNPFAGANAKMVAQRDAEDEIGLWRQEKRNIVEDFKKIFGQDISNIDGIAIMTDTDNSGQKASTYYGDIYFTAE